MKLSKSGVVQVSEPYVDHATIDSRAYGAIPLSLVNGRLLADLWSDCP